MKIAIAAAWPPRRWQVRLADDLRAAGHAVGFRFGPPRARLGFGLAAALRIEQRLFGPRQSLFDPADGRDLPSIDDPDLLIRLDGRGDGEASLEPLFDGAPGDLALLAMLAGKGDPTFTVRARDASGERTIVAACLAVEDREVLSRAVDAVLARTISLLCHAVRRVERHAPADDSLRGSGRPSRREGSIPAAIARALAAKVRRRLLQGRRPPQRWRIAYRRATGSGIVARDWTDGAFTVLAQDGLRFLADPMPFVHGGRDYVFYENFPYATGKGVIDVVEIAADGMAGTPSTVLEEPVHLSYPLVLRHRDAIYMIPEMNEAARVQLFRADPFPRRWVPDRVLVDRVVAADATPIFHQGIWWMFASLAGDGGSSWDQLALFSAPDLLGPWTPHRDNPVLVDAGAARPAGAMWIEDGTLMRVAQDCRDGYGKALVLCRVDRLDAEGYRQTVVAHLGPPPGTGAHGVHTLGRAGSLEVIDLQMP